MAFFKPPNRGELEKALLNDPKLLKETINKNSGLLNFIYSNADVQRKYVKLTPGIESRLKQISDETGIPEGILIGLGLSLLLNILYPE